MPPVCLCVNVLLLTTSLFGRQRLRVSVASFDVACLQRRQQHGNIATATSTTTLQDTLGKVGRDPFSSALSMQSAACQLLGNEL